jgi:hypothetical protein
MMAGQPVSSKDFAIGKSKAKEVTAPELAPAKSLFGFKHFTTTAREAKPINVASGLAPDVTNATKAISKLRTKIGFQVGTGFPALSLNSASWSAYNVNKILTNTLHPITTQTLFGSAF